MAADVTRRAVIAGAGSAMAGAACMARPQPDTLAAAARRSGRTYGAAVELRALREDFAFAETVMRECDTLTPELSLKWDAIEPEPGRPDLTRMDALAAFARRRGKPLYGHALLWDQSTPGWAAFQMQRDRDWGLVHRHFALVTGRYGEQVRLWDVVNEPVEPQHQADGLRESAFLAAFGPDYIRRAFDSARSLAPSAGLLLNEYGLEYDDAIDEARRSRLLRLIDELRRTGAPLDGVGLQGHLDLRRGHVAQEKVAGLVEELASRGLFVLVTELDVKEAEYVLPAERRDAEAAAAVKAYLDAVLASPAVRSVTTWGLADRYSWLKVTEDDRARWPMAWRDGTDPGLNRGLPLDAALERKPMYVAIRDAFLAAPPAGRAGGRNPTGGLSSDGSIN